MDRKRVPGPELSVAPLVEYPVDHKRWTPYGETRHDAKRQPEDMRPIYLKTGLINQANGSAYIELEKTKLACGVYGPRPIKRTGQGFSGKGVLNCEIKFATFSCAKRRSNMRDPQEKELSLIVTQALTPAVRLELLPKSAIDVYITVLESDGWGSCLSAAITCASAALAHAGIEMLDLVAGCSASYISNVPESSSSSTSGSSSIPPQIYMDADLEEEKYEQGAIVLAYMPSLNEVTHVLQSGKAESTTISQSVEHCVEACNKIYAVMHHALLESINESKNNSL
ncbi:exosome complex component MTR3 [Entomortierella parvispora]|uniref:Exosome complex component MTR3 n=1 Tax=Entomortierella parvispora TaxID=205924 RepID=A0A9P3HGP1_9FUNG|nr:exosome complex component MTR3 [Entomortierella parvispora]